VKTLLFWSAIPFLSLTFCAEAKACASCGCTLSSDWENLNLSGHAGVSLDLRYDDLNQNVLWSGTQKISAVAASALSHNGQTYEVEKFTKNSYTTLGIDYTSGTGLAVNIQVPLIERDHETLGSASDGVVGGAGGGQYRSSTHNLGDIKLVARYQGFASAHNMGILLGVKLPTGSHELYGTSLDATLPGPVVIDRGLQPGSGTTDIILGAYYAAAISKDYDLFVQGVYQSALQSRDGYRPGDGINFNLGLRYMGFGAVTPQVQLNARQVRADSGEAADTVSTGGTLVYLSPGVTAHLSDKASLYAYAQIPLYQNVRGIQLTPRATLSLGVRYHF